MSKKFATIICIISIAVLVSSCSNKTIIESQNMEEEINNDIVETINSVDITTEQYSEETTEKQELIFPENFLDCTNLFYIKTSDYEIKEKYDSDLFGYAGKVSLLIGWDNNTIIGAQIWFFDGDRLFSTEEYDSFTSNLENIFGLPTGYINPSITDFNGNADYKVRLSGNGVSICIGEEQLAAFNASNPEAETQVVVSQETENKRSPEIGMTADEVRNSTWGSPDRINTTITANITYEQWCYSNNRYIYLENGIVTAIQK